MGSAGVYLTGSENAVRQTTIREMEFPGGYAIDLRGVALEASSNAIRPALPMSTSAFGIRLRAARFTSGERNVVEFNDIDDARVGLLVQGDVMDSRVSDNVVGNSRADGAQIYDAFDVEFDRNEIEGFGSNSSGILILNSWSNAVRQNEIFGGDSGQRGVFIQHDPTYTTGQLTRENVVAFNRIEGPGIGVRELSGTLNQIRNNVIHPMTVGIEIEDSFAASPQHVTANEIRGGSRGIDVKNGNAMVAQNRIFDVNDSGIEFVDGTSNEPQLYTGNEIRSVAAKVGIRAWSTQAVSITGNRVYGPTACVSAGNNVGLLISGNILSDCTGVAIALASNGFTTVAPNSLHNVTDVGVAVSSGSRDTIARQNFLSPAGNIAIDIGHQPGDSGGQINLLTVDNQLITTGFETAVRVGINIDELTITNGVFHGTDYGILGSTVGDAALTIELNEFRGGVMDGSFDEPVDTRRNDWSDSAILNLIDTDGDGFADCGTDHVFSSTNYTGTAVNAARTSFNTEQISDSEAATTTSGLCGP